MKKRLFAFLLAAATVLSIMAGCSGGGTSGANTDGVITLNFPSIWVGSDSKAAVFGKMVEDFNTEFAGKYEVKIEEQTDYDAYNDKVRTQISTGAAPDIFTIKSLADLQLFSQSGKLMDLTSLLDEPTMASKFSVGAVDGSKIDGKAFAVPYEMAVLPTMVNGSLLEDNNLKMPTSYEELWDVCETLKKAGIAPIGQMTGNNAWSSMLWYSQALAAIGGADVYEKGLDDPAFVEAAKILKKMFEYTTSDAVGADASVVNGHFFNERVAFYTNGSWILGRVKSEGVEGLYENLQIAPVMSLGGNNGGAYITSVQAFLAAGKQDDPAKEEAVREFFRFVSDTERVLDLANDSGSLFAISIEADKIVDPLQSEIVVQMEKAPFTIGTFEATMPTAVANAFPAALEELVLGDIDEKEFVQRLKDAA